MAGMRILSQEAALTALQLGRELREGKRKLPPEIVEKKKEIAAATRNAELFMARTGAVDYGMVDHAVALRLELDALYAQWAESEAPNIIGSRH